MCGAPAMHQATTLSPPQRPTCDRQAAALVHCPSSGSKRAPRRGGCADAGSSFSGWYRSSKQHGQAGQQGRQPAHHVRRFAGPPAAAAAGGGSLGEPRADRYDSNGAAAKQTVQRWQVSKGGAQKGVLAAVSSPPLLQRAANPL